MECIELHRRLIAGEPWNGAEGDAHIASCAPCRELVAADGTLAKALSALDDRTEPRDLDALRMCVEQTVVADRGPVAWARSRRQGVRLALATAWVVVLGAAGIVAGLRPDFTVYPALRMTLSLVGYVSLTVSVLFSGLRPAQSWALNLQARRLLLLLLVLLPIADAALPPAHSLHPASLAGTGVELVPRALGCFSFGSIVGISTLLGLMVLDRGGGSSWVRLPLLVGASVLAGSVAVSLHCPITVSDHLLLGHATLSAFWLAAVGVFMWLVGRRPTPRSSAM